jgi:hypothetical protein
MKLLWYFVTEVGRECLPLGSEHPMPLQVAEGTVVRDDLKPVANRLEAPARTVTAILTIGE